MLRRNVVLSQTASWGFAVQAGGSHKAEDKTPRLG
jgi:hypothetical protein